MGVCSVYGCNERFEKDKHSNSVSFHTFPNREKSPERFAKWVEFCHRKKFTPFKTSRICSKHFRTTDFDPSQLMKLKLMPDARLRGAALLAGTVPSMRLDVEEPSSSADTDLTRTVRYRKKERKILVESILEPPVIEPEPKLGLEADNSDPDPFNLDTEAEDLGGGTAREIVFELDDNDKSMKCELGSEILRFNSDYCRFNSIKQGTDDPNVSTFSIDSELLKDSDSSDASSDSEDEKEFEPKASNKQYEYFLVSWLSLLQIFELCFYCHKKVSEIKRSVLGTAVTVKALCSHCDREKIWISQPFVGRRPEGNIMVTSALLLSGILFSSFKSFCAVLKIPMFCRSTFYQIINSIAGPVIKQRWQSERSSNLLALKDSAEPIWLAGDGQYDSPGFSAKYITYSMMDLHSMKIVDFELVQKRQIKGELEKPGCERLLSRLIKEENCDVQLFLSDRHKGVRCFWRTQYPGIQHAFDVWHLSKSLMKKFKVHDKKHPKLFAWKKSINNHLWWSAQTCDGNAETLVERFQSILYHIRNIHEWEEDGVQKSCEHQPICPTEQRKKQWLKFNSEEYHILKKIIMVKAFTKDLEHAKHYVHTGSLESYHNLRLKYAPKRVHFSFEGLYLRSILAILDHNSNIIKRKIGEKVQFSKVTGQWVMKARFSSSDDTWKIYLAENILNSAKRHEIPHIAALDLSLPKNIAPHPCPSREILQIQKLSRFSH